MKEKAIKIASSRRQIKIDLAKAKAERKLAAALSVAEIKEAHSAYVTAKFQAALSGIDANLAATHKRYLNALKKHGYSEADFEYTPLCPVCNDTGNIHGKVCRCFWKDYLNALAEVCDIQKKAPFTFDDCKLEDVKDSEQRNKLKSIYDFMQKYSGKLPDVNLKNIVFSGGTGTGKTCLASAVARKAVDCGKSCKFASAFEFNSEMLGAHTSSIAERTSRLHDVLTADLLVIDDLGVEPMYKNVTREYLLLILEERTRANLCTLITTNLDWQDIQAKYGDRICSRLLDKKHSRIVCFGGNDLRL